MKSRLLVIALLASFSSRKKEYNFICGTDVSEPYVYTIMSNGQLRAVFAWTT